MTPNEKSIVKSLVAVAWADGNLEAPETGVFEGLLFAFDATEDEEQEILEYAKERRTLGDIPLNDLGRDDRELLLGNAALLVCADGVETDDERQLLGDLTTLLEIPAAEARRIIEGARAGAKRASRPPPKE